MFSDFFLNFNWECLKCFSNKFSKFAMRWGTLRLQRPLNIDSVHLRLRDLAKLCFFKLLMMKSNLKKSVMTSFQWRHHYYVTEKCNHLTSQDFSILGPSQSKFLATPVSFSMTYDYIFDKLWFHYSTAVEFFCCQMPDWCVQNR